MANTPRLVLVDGSSSLYRAYHALPPLSNSRGMPTQAILGFTTMLLKLLREEQPDAVGVAFDGPGPTARHRDYPEYKAQRPEMPEALARQIPAVHRVVEAMRIPVLKVAGEEADDILATLAVRAAADGNMVALVTGDKDLLQVVTDRIVVRDTMKQRTSGPREVQERYGVPPDRLPDLFALMGDSIDNIPGIPGVGEKTARDLLRQFGTLEQLLRRVEEVPRPKLKELLRKHAERARLSKRLATVRTDLDLPWVARDLRRQPPDVPVLVTLFGELEFSRLVQQFSQGHFQISS